MIHRVIIPIFNLDLENWWSLYFEKNGITYDSKGGSFGELTRYLGDVKYKICDAIRLIINSQENNLSIFVSGVPMQFVKFMDNYLINVNIPSLDGVVVFRASLENLFEIITLYKDE